MQVKILRISFNCDLKKLVFFVWNRLGMISSSATLGTTAQSFDTASDIQRLCTPPDSARSYYSASAQASGHHTARTEFFTPQLSPEGPLSLRGSARSSPQHEGRLPHVLPILTQALGSEAARGELLLRSQWRTSGSFEEEECENNVNGTSLTKHLKMGDSVANANIPGKELRETARDSACAPNAPTGDVECSSGPFKCDGMSEAYEMIPDFDSSSCIENSCIELPGRNLPQATDLHDDHQAKIDSLAVKSALTVQASAQAPSTNSLQPQEASLHRNQIVGALEPAVSMAAPNHAALATKWPCAFSSADEAQQSIGWLSSVLSQLQNLHGECNLDVLLTCARLASAHHFMKKFRETKNLYLKCLRISSRCPSDFFCFLRMVRLSCCAGCLGPGTLKRAELMYCCKILNLKFKIKISVPEAR
jgi:hypothetical protein